MLQSESYSVQNSTSLLNNTQSSHNR